MLQPFKRWVKEVSVGWDWQWTAFIIVVMILIVVIGILSWPRDRDLPQECQYAYSQAKTAADSARADRIFLNKRGFGRPITCGALRHIIEAGR